MILLMAKPSKMAHSFRQKTETVLNTNIGSKKSLRSPTEGREIAES